MGYKRDPLSSFLFVIAMKCPKISLKEACEQHSSQVISLPINDPLLSHIFYAHDMTFIGEWSESNLINLNRIL